MSEFTKQYTDLLTIQYYNKPKAVGTIESFAKEYEKLFDLFESFENAFDIDFAVGKQLDILGKVVGINRNIPLVIPKKYFDLENYPMGDKFELVITYPIKDKFEIGYTDLQLNDNDYRFLIRCKIIKNFLNGKRLTDIQLAIDFIFENKGYVVDNKNMSFSLYLPIETNTDLLNVILALDLFPRPNAINYDTIIGYTSNSFGFSDNPNSYPMGDKFESVIGGTFSNKLNIGA